MCVVGCLSVCLCLRVGGSGCVCQGGCVRGGGVCVVVCLAACVFVCVFAWLCACVAVCVCGC